MDLPSTASFIFYSSGLTLSCQFFNFSIFIRAYVWLPVQTRLNSFDRFNHLSLIILRSIASIQRAFFLDFLFYLFFAASHVVSNCTFSFFLLFSFFFIALILLTLLFLFSLLFFYKCRNVQYAICKCHDRSYQCVMQPLCPDMPLTNFVPLT